MSGNDRSIAWFQYWSDSAPARQRGSPFQVWTSRQDVSRFWSWISLESQNCYFLHTSLSFWIPRTDHSQENSGCIPCLVNNFLWFIFFQYLLPNTSRQFHWVHLYEYSLSNIHANFYWNKPWKRTILFLPHYACFHDMCFISSFGTLTVEERIHIADSTPKWGSPFLWKSIPRKACSDASVAKKS